VSASLVQVLNNYGTAVTNTRFASIHTSIVDKKSRLVVSYEYTKKNQQILAMYDLSITALETNRFAGAKVPLLTLECGMTLNQTTFNTYFMLYENIASSSATI
jgi:hypothetical protein